jgi:DNA polymerase-1
MKYLYFSEHEKPTYRVAILATRINKDSIIAEYITPFNLDKDDVIVINLHQAVGKKKTPAAEIKLYIREELQAVLDDLQVEYVLVADGDYFKAFGKTQKSDANIGYVFDSAFGNQKVSYLPNYQQVFYDPQKVRAKISQCVLAVLSHMGGTYAAPGASIIKYADYPHTVDAIRKWLIKLLKYPALSCDIEAFSLKHHDAGIGTITFCWNQEEGIAFPVDFLNKLQATEVREMLREFFEIYEGNLMYHSISYDVYVLVYQLFMDHILDQAGMLYGLDVMLKNWHDTKLITYLATNTCAGNKLSLKEQAQEYAGNYAKEDIKDINKIPLPELLQYNLVDGLSTWFVYNKHYPTMVNDNQLDIYETIFKPAIVDIIQMQLTGMPVDAERVKEITPILQADSDNAVARMLKLPLIKQFEYMRLEAYTEQKNSEWVNKRMTVSEMAELSKTHAPTKKEVTFNPNSGNQLQVLLYQILNLPVIAVTDTKQPATGGETLEALKNHTDDPKIHSFLDALVDYKSVDKILTTVIPALQGAILGNDGWHYLFGNFNLGGTLSGRLSSSEPNLQNLPSKGTRYAKLIKSCFKAPPGWLFCGIDFDSLEDRISALTTKDPNKLKVYTDGYDGHCLRAFSYFGDQMPSIVDTVVSINSIAEIFADQRQDSKAPTFALTYQGTYRTLMTNCGFSQAKAIMVEAAYHALYVVSDKWVSDKLDIAMKDGFITAAFGLRLRTPLLKQVIRGTRKTPFEAEAEGRTAGNALGQSWCLLNSRAGSEFMGKVRKSEHRLFIKPCSQIHDAQYYLIKDDIDVVMYANDNVVKACQWQNHSDIAHPDVKLGGKFSIFYPTWDKETTIPNNASADQIYQAVQKHMDKLAA